MAKCGICKNETDGYEYECSKCEKTILRLAERMADEDQNLDKECAIQYAYDELKEAATDIR